MDIKIEQLKTFSSEFVPQINSLLIQLDSDVRSLDDEEARQIIENQANRFIIARDLDNRVVGMLILIVCITAFVKKAIIEDVVVDEKYRGRGIGSALVKYALDQAKKENVKYVDLTSRPERVEANRLYDRLGFEKRETNVYRINL